MKSIICFFAFIFSYTFSVGVLAKELLPDMVVDKFGQKVPFYFKNKIEKARKLRRLIKDEDKIKASIIILNEMIEEKMDYYRGYYNLALAYSAMGDYEKTKNNFDKAIEIREEHGISDATVFNSSGWTSLNVQDYARAEKMFKKGASLTKINSRRSNRALFNNLGKLYFYTQKFDESEKYLKKAIQYGSRYAEKTLEIIKKIRLAGREKIKIDRRD